MTHTRALLLHQSCLFCIAVYDGDFVIVVSAAKSKKKKGAAAAGDKKLTALAVTQKTESKKSILDVPSEMTEYVLGRVNTVKSASAPV